MAAMATEVVRDLGDRAMKHKEDGNELLVMATAFAMPDYLI